MPRPESGGPGKVGGTPGKDNVARSPRRPRPAIQHKTPVSTITPRSQTALRYCEYYKILIRYLFVSELAAEERKIGE